MAGAPHRSFTNLAFIGTISRAFLRCQGDRGAIGSITARDFTKSVTGVAELQQDRAYFGH